MRLYLIRHAITPETGNRLSGRTPGISLSPAGHKMAEDLGTHLASIKLDAIYTSPIERCRETAAAVASGRKMQPSIDKAFIEADFGSWTGRTLKSLYKLKSWQDLMVAPARFRFPDGETLGEVQNRAVAGVERLAAKHKKAAIAVASHSDVIRVTLAHYLGMPLDLIHRLDVLPASVSIVDLHASGSVRVPVMNHIAGPGSWR